MSICDLDLRAMSYEDGRYRSRSYISCCLVCAWDTTLPSPCHLVPSIRWILATVIVSLLHAFRSLVASLSSGRFILIVSCISSIHLFLGRPLPRFPSPHASIISFSMPSARITWPKYVTFCLVALCLNDISPLKCPISSSICSFVLFSVQDTYAHNCSK